MSTQLISEKKTAENKIYQKTDISKGWLIYKKLKNKKQHPLKINLPHHWQNEKNYETHTGTVIYTKKIKIKPDKSLRYFIRFAGIFYSYKIYVNGKRLLKDKGYFTPVICEIPKKLLSENIKIKVVVKSTDEKNLMKKKHVTGIFGHWDCREPNFNSGGIWQKVSLIETGKIFIKESLLTTEDIFYSDEGQTACLTKFDITLSSNIKKHASLRISLTPENFTSPPLSFIKSITLQKSSHQNISFNMQFDNIKLWFPHDLGYPYNYRIKIDVFDEDILSHTASFSYGFRKVSWDDWKYSINNKKVYAKGLNIAPLRFRMADVIHEEWDKEFEVLKMLNCNMIRVHGHVQPPEFYEYADKHGILIFQDFPLQWLYSRRIINTALTQMKNMIKVLYNHPSIIIWSCHNEPFYMNEPEKLDESSLKDAWRVINFNYNRIILDRKLKSVAKNIDKTRFVNRASSIYSIIGFKGTDIHAYWGWYFSKMSLINTIRRVGKRNLKFVSEFGPQSIPNYKSAIRFMPKKFDKTDWLHLQENHNAQPRLLHKYVPIEGNDDLKSYIKKSQQYQHDFLQYYIDLIRLVKNNPGGGMLAFMYRSCHPGIDWSIVDYWGERKKAFTTIRRGFQSIYPFIFINGNNIANKSKNLINFYITNDLPLEAKELKFIIRVKSGRETVYKEENHINIPAFSDAIKISSLKLDNFTEKGTFSVLIIAVFKGKSYKNKYTIGI
jgi:beta-mannosidase